MSLPDPAALRQALEETWPPAVTLRRGGWILRRGDGGGKRVSAATTEAAEPDLASLEAWAAETGEPPLVLVRSGEDALDARLAAAGFGVIDPVVIHAAPVASLARQTPPLSAFALWPPLAVMTEIWAEGGIGPARRRIMERVTAPKTALLGRTEDHAAGVAFVAAAEGVAVLHALEVRPAYRRRGTARNLLASAALWAEEQGASQLALAVTRANAPADALYASLGMVPVEHYHYRQKTSP